MTKDEKFRHRESFPWAQVSYWRERTGMISAADKAEATEAHLLGPGGQHPQLTFKLPEQRYSMEETLSLMEQAHEVGKLVKAREIMDVLGVSEVMRRNGLR